MTINHVPGLRPDATQNLRSNTEPQKVATLPITAPTWRAVGTPTSNRWGPNELASSQYAPFHQKKSLFSFFWMPTPKKREHSRERTWTADAQSTNFAHFGVRECAKIRFLNRVRSMPRAAEQWRWADRSISNRRKPSDADRDVPSCFVTYPYPPKKIPRVSCREKQPTKRKMFVVVTKLFMEEAADFARSR